MKKQDGRPGGGSIIKRQEIITLPATCSLLRLPLYLMKYQINVKKKIKHFSFHMPQSSILVSYVAKDHTHISLSASSHEKKAFLKQQIYICLNKYKIGESVQPWENKMTAKSHWK